MAAAGWFPDPEGEGRIRYWNGARWTEHTRELPIAPPAGSAEKTRRARRLRLVGSALVAAGLLFSLMPSYAFGDNLWTWTERDYRGQNYVDRWAPFSGAAIAENQGAFVALVVFGLAGLVCLLWPSVVERRSDSSAP